MCQRQDSKWSEPDQAELGADCLMGKPASSCVRSEVGVSHIVLEALFLGGTVGTGGAHGERQATLAWRSLGSVYGGHGQQRRAVRGRARRWPTGCILYYEAQAPRLLISSRGTGLCKRRTEVQVQVKGVRVDPVVVACSAGVKKAGTVENVEDLRANEKLGGPSKRQAPSGQARLSRLSTLLPDRRLHQGGPSCTWPPKKHSGIGVCVGLAQMYALQDCCCRCKDGAMQGWRYSCVCTNKSVTNHGTVCCTSCMHFMMAFCLLPFSCI